MRYMIVETSWTMMSLAQELQASGLLLTRTDRPEDVPLFLEQVGADILVIELNALKHAKYSLSALREISPHTPIALIMPHPTSSDIAKWLDAGADAVIPTGADLDEVAFQLHALARRAHGLGRSELAYGPLRIDLQARKVSLRTVAIKLSPKLYELLEYIALRPGRLVARADLLSHIYGLENEPDARVFDVYMCNLRACLSDSDGHLDIETVRGAGYRFLVNEDDDQIAA